MSRVGAGLLPGADHWAALACLAPGTELGRGVESRLDADGALIVVGAEPAGDALLNGGFHLDCTFSAARP